jgi:hypothetical protein
LGGEQLLRVFLDSPIKLLSSIYPDYEWLPWKFGRAPRDFWTNPKNQRNFLEYVAKELNIKEMKDWYKVTTEVLFLYVSQIIIFQDIKKLGGLALLNHHSRSIAKLLPYCYPEYNWEPWRFETAINIWTDLENQKKFLEMLVKELNIKDMSDWYKVKTKVSPYLEILE